MGLDMEIRRISKPNLDDTVVYNRGELLSKCIILDEGDIKLPIYQQLE